MNALTTTQLHYNPRTRTFSQEISSLRGSHIIAGRDIKVTNPETGRSKMFHFSHRDEDGSGEDVYGWNYECDGIKLLIIND